MEKRRCNAKIIAEHQHTQVERPGEPGAWTNPNRFFLSNSFFPRLYDHISYHLTYYYADRFQFSQLNHRPYSNNPVPNVYTPSPWLVKCSYLDVLSKYLQINLIIYKTCSKSQIVFTVLSHYGLHHP